MAALKEIVKGGLKKLPLKNIILFESMPDFSDNTILVYNELVRRGVDKKYKLIWLVHDKESLKNKSYSTVYYENKKAAVPYYSVAKMFISGNLFLEKCRSEQYYLHLSHGAALKNCADTYSLPKFVDNFVAFSPFMGKYDAINYNCDIDKMVCLGYARNDILFDEPIDLHTIFESSEFDKAVYWMPTYRQQTTGHIHSSISMPIIYDEEIADKINAYAREKRVLIIVKPHPAQDISRILRLSLSNLVFIDNTFLKAKCVENYELLKSVDALISDYSSVYYDYLLVDKPIGLCFDDFEEYKKTEGFTVDPDFILAGGERLYNADDLNAFIGRVSSGEDVLKDKRNEIKQLVHTHTDNHATQRIADFIEEKLKDL